MVKFRNIDMVYTIMPKLQGDDTFFNDMKFMEAYDTNDLDEYANPRDMSYATSKGKSGQFPVLKLSPDHVPVGDSGDFCLHFAWKYKNPANSSYHPVGS